MYTHSYRKSPLKEDNLSTKDKTAGPEGILIKRFHCTCVPRYLVKQNYLQQLTGEKKSPEAARMALNAYFSNKKTSTVLFADELDLLSTRKQEVLYDMTSWPFASNSQLVLLGVANTMNLPDRISENKKLSSRMVSWLHFCDSYL